MRTKRFPFEFKFRVSAFKVKRFGRKAFSSLKRFTGNRAFPNEALPPFELVESFRLGGEAEALRFAESKPGEPREIILSAGPRFAISGFLRGKRSPRRAGVG